MLLLFFVRFFGKKKTKNTFIRDIILKENPNIYFKYLLQEGKSYCSCFLLFASSFPLLNNKWR